MKRMMITLLWALLFFFLLMDNVSAQNSLTVQVYRAGTADPLSGFQVVLKSPPSPGSLTASRFKNSGSNGQAVFNNVAAGDYTLSASKSSCSNSIAYTMPANNANITIEVLCPEPRTLNVRVNQAGKPGEWIAGATVSLRPTSQSGQFLIGQSFGGVTTNNLGFAILTDVIPGPYQLRVTRSDCGTNNVQYQMPAADATTTAELACPVISNLRIHVSQQGTGQALAGVTIQLNPPGTFSIGTPSGSTSLVIQSGVPQGTTDSNGNVVFTGVEEGSYTLAVFKNNCQTLNTSYTMPANNTNTSVDLNCGNSLTVHVSQQGLSSGGVSGVKVEVTAQSSSTPSVQVTDQTGNALFPNIYSGNYTIKASKIGCSQSSQSFSMPYASASADLPLNCKLSRGNKLTVLVFEAGTLIGKRAEWIAGAKVRLAALKSPNKFVEATTDNSGRAEFDKVALGAYLITVTKPGCSSKSTTHKMPASISTVNIDLVCSGGKSTQRK